VTAQLRAYVGVLVAKSLLDVIFHRQGMLEMPPKHRCPALQRIGAVLVVQPSQPCSGIPRSTVCTRGPAMIRRRRSVRAHFSTYARRRPPAVEGVFRLHHGFKPEQELQTCEVVVATAGWGQRWHWPWPITRRKVMVLERSIWCAGHGHRSMLGRARATIASSVVGHDVAHAFDLGGRRSSWWPPHGEGWTLQRN